MNTENEQTNPSAPAPDAGSALSPLETSDTAFIREKIKARPINKRKLFRRTLVTGLLAIVFGGVACLTFLLLEPFFSSRITPEETPEPVTFPTSDDEIQPEDLYADDEEIATAQEQIVAETIQANIEASEQDRIDAAVSTALARLQLNKNNASELYRALKHVAADTERSLVLVRSATTQTSFVGGTIELDGEVPGLIIADNGLDLLILTYASILDTGDDLTVTLNGGEVEQATLKMADPGSGLCVLRVSRRSLTRATQELVAPAPMGSTITDNLIGTPVIAVGSPIGIYPSVCYGMIASGKIPMECADRALKLFATDIISDTGMGFLFNYDGRLLGMIYPGTTEGLDKNRILAWSISESVNLIEHLSNGSPGSSLGIYGTDFTAALADAGDLPDGAYVLRTEMNSPAMSAGLQSGDIIVSFRDQPVTSWNDYVKTLEAIPPDETVTLEILRQGPEDYLSMQLTMSTREGNP